MAANVMLTNVANSAPTSSQAQGGASSDMTVLATGMIALHAKDFATALALFGSLAKNGNPLAQGALGMMYDQGQGVPQSHTIAAQWYLKAAEQGVAPAQNLLGIDYKDGTGVKQDYGQAAYWFMQAAQQGFAQSQTAVGGFYENGWGFPQDSGAAFFWFSKAAEQGDAAGQYNLAVAYDRGMGVDRDLKKAAFWCRRAAEQGLVQAEMSLAQLYEKGHGVARNQAEARKWLVRAAGEGDMSAEHALRSGFVSDNPPYTPPKTNHNYYLCSGPDWRSFTSVAASPDCAPVRINPGWIEFLAWDNAIVAYDPHSIQRKGNSVSVWLQFYLANVVPDGKGRYNYDAVKSLNRFQSDIRHQMLIEGTYSLAGNVVYNRTSKEEEDEDILPHSISELLVDALCPSDFRPDMP